VDDVKAFWDLVEKLKGENACWIWKGPKYADHYPYGIAQWKGRKVNANRVSWMISKGLEAIPHSMRIRHRCKNIICVRPEHLFSGGNNSKKNIYNISWLGGSATSIYSMRALMSHDEAEALWEKVSKMDEKTNVFFELPNISLEKSPASYEEAVSALDRFSQEMRVIGHKRR
jgi:hypothetical protein